MIWKLTYLVSDGEEYSSLFNIEDVTLGNSTQLCPCTVEDFASSPVLCGRSSVYVTYLKLTDPNYLFSLLSQDIFVNIAENRNAALLLSVPY